MIEERAWTAQQLRAIERRDGDLLLDAGAGSGKTSVLVERFARAVLEDGVEVSSILTITFTDKAAAELRDRIRARLRELGAREQARATEGAFISTIHGFCARVLRANALIAGLDPGFVVLDRSQSEPLTAAAFDDALQRLAGGGDAVGLVADYGAGSLRAAILSVYGQLRSSGQLAPRLPACSLSFPDSPARVLDAAALALAAELGAIGDPSASVAEALGRLDRCRELLMVADLWPAELERVKLPGNGAALSTDACVAYREALAHYRAACAARTAAPVRDLMDALLAVYGERYGERKREISGLDFEDLELITRKLLRTHEELRERYAARFERIMVDELQDTNRVQLELIESIARGNLFTVGDAQQSIYGFRHADVELFERRGERLAASGERETLQTNFRSRPEILAAINQAFADQLGERFTALVAGRPERQGGGDVDPSLEVLLVDKGADWELEGLASPWRLAEASALADRVAELVAAGTPLDDVVVLTRATTDMRAYERALERRGLPTYVIGGRGYWSHPQVLDLVAYLRALANPRDEEALYAVLASPLVGVSLDALVVLGGCARELGRDPWWILREPDDQLRWLGAEDRGALAQFASWFGHERSRAGRSGIEDVIDRALERTGYDLAMLAMPGGRRRLANVRKLMRLGREYEGGHGPDLRGFLELISEREAGRAVDSRESEAPVEGEGLDAIRLMTIHRAKGLEFGTVCVADLGRSTRPPYEILRVSADGRLGLRLIRAGVAGRVAALDYDAIGAETKKADESEERRLFYVAMTRAQERLILSGATRFEGWTQGRGTGGGPIAWIAPAFVPELGQRIADGGGAVDAGPGPGVPVRLTIAAPDNLPRAAGVTPCIAAPPPLLRAGEPPPSVELPPAAVPTTEPPPTDPAPPVATLSYSSLGEYARCGYRFYAERVLGLPPLPSARPSAEGEPALGEPGMARSAADRGVLLHALLERLDFRRPVALAATAIVATAACLGFSPSPGPEEADELAALVRRFGASELCRRLAGTREARREQRFGFGVGSVLVTGAIDVIAHEPGNRTLIVDYKSDRLDGGEPKRVVQGSYATQRLVYALAALHAGAETVEIAHCFLERPEDPVIVCFVRSEQGELERELNRLAAGVLRRKFEVSETPHARLCAGCPAEGGLCSWPLEATRRPAVDRLF